MDLSIIIVNWNTCDLLANCLASIERSCGSLKVQTIVVDNHSADGSREMVRERFPGMLLIDSGGNLGFARANNLALPHLQAPLVLYLNPDTEVNTEALQKMVSFIDSHPEVGALGPKIRDASGDVQQLGLQWFPSPVTELLKFLFLSDRSSRLLAPILPWHDPHRSGYLTKLFGACLLVRRSVLDKVGAFDERFFMYCEDVDLCHRVSEGGWKLYYQSEIEILHLGASASEKAPGAFAVLMGCESFHKFMRKYYGILGSGAYRAVVLVGSQARLLLLLGIRLLSAILPARKPRDLKGSIRKHLTITKWALGLQKAVIRN